MVDYNSKGKDGSNSSVETGTFHYITKDGVNAVLEELKRGFSSLESLPEPKKTSLLETLANKKLDPTQLQSQ